MWSLFLGARRLQPGVRRFSRADDRRLQEITTRHFPDGYTILGAAGGWYDPSARRFVREESRQILIASASAAQVRRWAHVLGTAFRQKELMLVEAGRAFRLKIKGGAAGLSKPLDQASRPS
jgi:hypothetical protein